MFLWLKKTTGGFNLINYPFLHIYVWYGVFWYFFFFLIKTFYGFLWVLFYINYITLHFYIVTNTEVGVANYTWIYYNK